FPSFPVQRNTDTTIKGTAPCVNGEQKPEAPLSAALNGLVPLEVDSYNRLLEQLHDAVYLVDNQRTILYWSEAAERLTGCSPSEVIGRHCFDGLLDHADLFGCCLCHRECPLAQSMKLDRP